MMSDDLAAFLLARIAEDEVAALAATRNAWRVEDWSGLSGGSANWMVVGDFDVGAAAFHVKNEPDAVHIARHDPARVLVECAAKRGIVDEHQVTRRTPGYTYLLDPPCVTCGQVRPRRFPCPTLRLLALPYADHPDYREEWRP